MSEPSEREQRIAAAIADASQWVREDVSDLAAAVEAALRVHDDGRYEQVGWYGKGRVWNREPGYDVVPVFIRRGQQ